MVKNYLIVLLTVLSFTNSSAQKTDDNTKYIDPTIGNVSRFLVPTYPTIHLPNQMLRMFPVKQDYISDMVQAFPFQVTAHRRPGILQMKTTLGEVKHQSWNKGMVIDHDLEKVHPWLYSTYLIEDDIKVSFAPSKKSAIYKVDFPKGKQKNFLIKGTKDMQFSKAKNAFSILEKRSKSTKGEHATINTIIIFVYGEIVDENNKPIENISYIFNANKLQITADKTTPATLYIKYAISYVSATQAKENFKKELKNKSFDGITEEGKKAWDNVTNQIQVEGGTTAQKRTFYTSLYRTYERMVDVNEYGHYYSGYDKKVHKSKRPFYVDDWIWDTYLAQHPLRTILNPPMENEILNSYTLMYEQAGWMPTFPQVFGNHLCMNSYHSSAIFIDGYRKGLKKYDVEKAYQGIKKNLLEGTFIPWRQGNPRGSLDDFYHENGYFPSLKIGETETVANVDDFEKRQPVAVSLGISYDFWALSQFAKELGKTEDHKKYAPKGNDYKNLWDFEQRLFMPKDANGKFLKINPKLDGGKGYREYYDENNGWTYAWSVQHDVEGLIDLLGGKKASENRLDQLFREDLGIRKSDFFINGSNSTGMVGQFSMGNEPSFHIPYLYNYFGAPWKTQKRTRFLLDVWFKDNIFGIPGDEDGGGMTAFVVFTSMGIYPVTPGVPYYNITSPIFEKTSIKLKNGRTFTVVAKGASKTKKYIQNAFINGKEINAPYISHEQIMLGATLTLELGELPNKEWGKNAIMPK